MSSSPSPVINNFSVEIPRLGLTSSFDQIKNKVVACVNSLLNSSDGLTNLVKFYNEQLMCFTDVVEKYVDVYKDLNNSSSNTSPEWLEIQLRLINDSYHNNIQIRIEKEDDKYTIKPNYKKEEGIIKGCFCDIIYEFIKLSYHFHHITKPIANETIKNETIKNETIPVDDYLFNSYHQE
ncbi:hypothetical protein QTN25_000385 [Entamoeba marina]